MFYGQMGGKDLLKRKWRDLTDFVTLECDGTDITHKLRSLRVHAIVFLNIPRYVRKDLIQELVIRLILIFIKGCIFVFSRNKSSD